MPMHSGGMGMIIMGLKNSKEIEKNRYELEVSVDRDTFQDAINQAYLKNKGKINVPGFRKGKAPKGIIEKMYGQNVFYEDAVDASYQKAYADAVEEAGLDTVDYPEFELGEIGEDGYDFKAKVYVRPQVEVSDYKGIEVTKNINVVTDSDVDEELKKMSEKNIRIVPVSGRAAKLEDTVVFDFEGFVDGVPFEGGKAEKFELKLGSGQFIPGFEEQMVDHNVDEDFDVNVKFPENYHSEELKDKDAVFKIHIHEIKENEYPEIDDEFAKDVSEFDTIAALRDDLKQKLCEQRANSSDIELENEIMDKIVSKLEGDIPDCMYERRIDDLMRDFGMRLQNSGLNIETYLQYSGMEMESIRKTFREQAEKQVRVRLALEKIVELESIKATQEDIDKEIQKIAENYGIEVDRVKNELPTEELEKDIAVNKAIDFVKENAKITEKQVEAEAKEDAKPAAKKPAAKKAAAKKTDDAKPAAKKPAAKQPAAKKPAAKKPATKKETKEEE